MKEQLLQISFDSDKLDALIYHMDRKDISLDAELSETIQKLYERHVPQSTREYIEDKVKRTAEKKPIKKKAPEKSLSSQFL